MADLLHGALNKKWNLWSSCGYLVMWSFTVCFANRGFAIWSRIRWRNYWGDLEKKSGLWKVEEKEMFWWNNWLAEKNIRNIK